MFIRFFVNSFSTRRLRRIDKFKEQPFAVQETTLMDLLNKAKDTEWGKRFDFNDIRNVEDFRSRLPLQRYEDVKPYVDRMRKGEVNVLWHSDIKWYAMSSGTTDDKSKYIPVSAESLETCHFRGGYDVLGIYAGQNPATKIFTSKTMTLGGSHQINKKENNSYFGDLSAILIENVPRLANLVRTPPAKIALLSNFDEKLDHIARCSVKERVVAFAGAPSWNMVLLKHILNYTGRKNILEVWPDMELFIHGGVSFAPYREQYLQLIPSSEMNYMETYNASEGFFAIQDDPRSDDMLLMLDYGIFYEFVPVDQVNKEFPETVTLDKVELNRNYAMVITTNSGLWRYFIGDTIVFTSLKPFKIKISGRTKQYINAFGEELIVDNAEKALMAACTATNAIISEYTAGPVFMTGEKNGTHEWLIEFEKEPECLENFTEKLDTTLCALNSDYEAKRNNNITLRAPIVEPVPKGAFYKWMKERGKLGGQNKVPRLSNDRKYLDDLRNVL